MNKIKNINNSCDGVLNLSTKTTKYQSESILKKYLNNSLEFPKKEKTKKELLKMDLILLKSKHNKIVWENERQVNYFLIIFFITIFNSEENN